MNRLFETIWRRFTILGLALALTAVSLLPMRALADGERQLDVGHRGGREGDPLDTNDAGNNPADDDIQDTAGKSGRTIFGGDFWSARILLVPQYNGATITFKVIFLSDEAQSVEWQDAK